MKTGPAITTLVFLLAGPGLLSSGCKGGVSRIAAETTETRTHAQTSKDLLESVLADTANIQAGIAVLTEENPNQSTATRLRLIAESTGDIEEKVNSAISHQDAILLSQDEVTKALTSVQDKEPSWLRALKLIALIVAPIAILALLWYTGLGLLIRKVLWSIGLFMPKSSDLSAKFDAEAVEEGSASQARREAVAARRASDPAFDIAYKKHQTRIRASKKHS